MSLEKNPSKDPAHHKAQLKKPFPITFKSLSLRGESPILPYFAFFGGLCLVLIYYILTRYRHLVYPLLKYLLPGGLALFFALTLTPLCIKTARKFKIVDKNAADRKDKFATPLLGGLAIYLAFFITLFLYRPWTPQMMSIIIGGSIIFLLGTLDDIKPVSSTIRLIGQVTACLIVMKAGLVVTFMPDTLWGDIIAYVLTFIAILGIINATNFVDGVDGLAAGFTVISSLFFLLIALHLQQYPVVIISSVLIGSCLGFLFFNFKPAKIYLGDGGSTFLGFMLACIALYGGWSSWGPIIAIGIPVIILGVLIFDLFYITISRIKNGSVKNFKQWLDYRGRDHFHHRLINLGFKDHEAVLFIYAICIILGLSALVIEHARVSYPVVVLFIQALLIFLLISMLMLKGRQIEKEP
jgi:UDP-GlcNAc:undecaprenyl-phosphate GlcNAc-1-phosphate transferase